MCELLARAFFPGLSNKSVRQIRAGIMAKCNPVLACTMHPDCDATIVDFVRLYEQMDQYNKHRRGPNSLAVIAFERTRPWASLKDEPSSFRQAK